jgi:formylglycine-generating enzyme required for sulfatase activity
MKPVKNVKSRNMSVLAAVAVAAAFQFGLKAQENITYEIHGRIESVRKGNLITILFERMPPEKYYLIINRTVRKDELGKVRIASINFDRKGRFRYRAVAYYELRNNMYKKFIRAGMNIALVKPGEPYKREFEKDRQVKEPGYRASIISGRDQREMLLVPEGKFLLGSRRGEAGASDDEFPQQLVYLNNYYIDKYEVSNRDYLRYMESANARAPISWRGKTYPAGEGNFPVQVTYHEARAYARWAGKRLPTELEWEKAARGTGLVKETGKRIPVTYPWGNRYEPGRVNSEDFWRDPGTGEGIKKRFSAVTRGLLPVDSFDPEGASPFGIINMAGNAREWTSSWYLPYKGNRSQNSGSYRRYGKQYKVIRGGAWFSSRKRVRAANRELGGIPNLYSDNHAGFRCVKEVSLLDQLED